MSARGSTSARGYGHAHQKMRAKWKPIVERGGVQCHADVCLMPDRAIMPGTTWHLGHTPDRTAWTGPEHERCNTSDGATRGNAGRTERPGPTQSRDWFARRA